MNWYAAGTARLLPQQRADGAWGGPGTALLDTAWRLGFLVRATLPVLPPGDWEQD
ncbi:MAG: hypothetical protein ACYTGX_02575 [Planctomycetota bacterium]